MEVTVEPYKRCDVLRISGRIDSETVPVLRQALTNLTDSGRYLLVLDMTEVTFVSSAGWWVLIDTQKTCKKNSRGEVVLANLASRIQSSLELVGMDEYFRSYGNITEAVGNIG
jgi:anti-sigma B factor antagonist